MIDWLRLILAAVAAVLTVGGAMFALARPHPVHVSFRGIQAMFLGMALMALAVALGGLS